MTQVYPSYKTCQEKYVKRLLLEIKDENPVYSAQIANEIAKVFTEKVKDIYNIDNVQIVDEAEVANMPSNINHEKDIIIFYIRRSLK